MDHYSPPIKETIFNHPLIEVANQKDPLVKLYYAINWENLILKISNFYHSSIGRPSADLRILISMSILQNIYNLSDQGVLNLWVQNYVFQAFSGQVFLNINLPFNSATLCNFRKQIGVEGQEIIFAESVRIHDVECLESKVIIDTTVQEKYTAFPTDVKLRLDVINQCWAFGEHLEIEFDVDYHDEVARLKKLINFTKSTNSESKKAQIEDAKLSLKDIANNLLDQLSIKAHDETKKDSIFIKSMENYRKAVNQQKDDKDKIYSIFEPQVYCIAKGKNHVKYEFGSKVSIVIGVEHKIVLGVVSFEKNTYDGDTVDPVLDMMRRSHNDYSPNTFVGDLGFRGRPFVSDVKGITTAELPSIADPQE
ncbi:MAG: transposase, partial [Bifidobacteriaceae bacterium]|nr:transposase [Bifidobacteriaceae bacterium]